MVVDGVAETWRLQWELYPDVVCGADEAEMSLTCPCSGFAYGEEGRLTLVRTRPGADSERLELGPLFIHEELPGSGPAVLRRWPPRPVGPNSDFDRGADESFVSQVRLRGSTDVMKLTDYDRDERATEFLLQVGTEPCGKHQMVVIGVSRRNPHLHVFSSVEHPQRPAGTRGMGMGGACRN